MAARWFGGHGRAYQELSAHAVVFQQRFAQAMSGCAATYAAAEAANDNPLQAVEENVLAVINTPKQALLGRPLIGDGAVWTAANPNGGAGGILYGNGGAGFTQTVHGVAADNGTAASGSAGLSFANVGGPGGNGVSGTLGQVGGTGVAGGFGS